ncbi:MAG: hypothetical protein WBM38_11045, partial [Arenicellales bacterium]
EFPFGTQTTAAHCLATGNGHDSSIFSNAARQRRKLRIFIDKDQRIAGSPRVGYEAWLFPKC